MRRGDRPGVKLCRVEAGQHPLQVELQSALCEQLIRAFRPYPEIIHKVSSNTNLIQVIKLSEAKLNKIT